MVSPIWWFPLRTRGLAGGDDCDDNTEEEVKLSFKVIAKFWAGRTDADLPKLKVCRSFSQLTYTLLKPLCIFSPRSSYCRGKPILCLSKKNGEQIIY